MRTLLVETKKRIASAVSLRTKSDKATKSAVDLLIADGFDKPTDYIGPKSKESTIHIDEWNALRAAVVLGFFKEIQTLLAKPIKSVSDLDKPTRRYWQAQIGARIADFKKQVTKRQDGSDGAGSRNRSLDQRVRDNLNDVIKVCQSAEEPTFSISAMIGKVKEALAILK